MIIIIIFLGVGLYSLVPFKSLEGGRLNAAEVCCFTDKLVKMQRHSPTLLCMNRFERSVWSLCYRQTSSQITTENILNSAMNLGFFL